MVKKKFIPNDETQKVAKRLKEIRTQKNLSLRDLALKLYNDDKRQDRIWDIEHNKTLPSSEEIKLYRKYFKLPYEYILGETDNMCYENMLIGKHIGLSDEAIEGIRQIRTLSVSKKFKPNESPIHVLNLLLGFNQNAFLFLIYYILEYLDFDKSDNIRYYDAFLPDNEPNNISDTLAPRIPFKEIDPEEDPEFYLFKIQKNFIDLIKEIKNPYKAAKSNNHREMLKEMKRNRGNKSKNG